MKSSMELLNTISKQQLHMTYSLSNNCTKNYYNWTLTLQVIVEDVVTWIFLETQCIYNVNLENVLLFYKENVYKPNESSWDVLLS